MIRQIKIRDRSYEHQDALSESEVRKSEPKFFNTKFGKRETHMFYRGGIISRCTVQFDGRKPKRETTVRLYFPNVDGQSHFHIVKCDATTIRQAKKAIDKILETGEA